MDFAEPPRKEPVESVVPMINVVFLLLVFFLMSATLAPPDPVEATPPTSEQAEASAEARAALTIAADGVVAYRDLRGAAAIAAAAEARDATAATPFQIRADAQAPAKRLAQTVAALGGLGVDRVAIVTLRAGG